MTATIKAAVAGADGRMGREIIRALAEDDAFTLALAFERAGHAAIGGKAADGASLIQGEDALQTTEAEVLIDFTAPPATMQFVDVCRRRRIGMVIGSTGFDDDERRRLQAAGEDIALLVAQNMSVGVNALYRIAAHAATTLKAGRLGGGYDIEISEEHHRHKIDAPSGTALRLGQTVAEATGSDFNQDAVFARHGAEVPRKPHDIGYSVVRGGDIVGTHRILFAGSGEQLEITHRSTSRANYVAGALQAAKAIAASPPRFYDGMEALLF